MPGMAWADTLLDCSFRGVVFDVVGTRDSFGHAISVAEVPYVDGGVVEDLGASPVRYSLQAVLFGDDYEDRLKALLGAFAERGVGVLVHPVHGVVPRAQCVSHEVVHAAPEPDSCTVQVEFVESGEPAVFSVWAGAARVQDEVGALGDSALDQAAAWLEEIVGAIRTAAPLAALDALRQSMLGPLLGFVGQVQGVATSGLDVLDVPRAWARDISALSNGVIAAASFGDNLLADWRAVTDTFSRLSDDFGYGGSAPDAAAAWRRGETPTQAQGVAVANAYLAVNNAAANADVAGRVLAAEFAAPSLSPSEIETVVNAARVEIDLAIGVVRAALSAEQSRRVVEPLKDQALALQQSGQAIIERRPPLIDRTVAAPGNLRLIAHHWYGDHSRAPELLRLNALRNPNALQKGDVLRAYAR